MKKNLLIVLLALLALTMFVACKDDPEVVDNSIAEVKLNGVKDHESGSSEQQALTATFYIKNEDGAKHSSTEPTSPISLYTDKSCSGNPAYYLFFMIDNNNSKLSIYLFEDLQNLDPNNAVFYSEAYTVSSGVTITTASVTFTDAFNSTFEGASGDFDGSVTIKFTGSATYLINHS